MRTPALISKYDMKYLHAPSTKGQIRLTRTIRPVTGRASGMQSQKLDSRMASLTMDADDMHQSEPLHAAVSSVSANDIVSMQGKGV